MRDGTYLKTNGAFIRLEATNGYWVATSETTLAETQDGEIVGIWNDPETGRRWIDKTQFIGDRTKAIATAKAFDQIAIWDNKRNLTIQTN
jgi:hypothetical protein